MSDFENTHDFINKLKEEGNLLFKRNEYDKSLEVYEKALNMIGKIIYHKLNRITL